VTFREGWSLYWLAATGQIGGVRTWLGFVAASCASGAAYETLKFLVVRGFERCR